MKMWTESNVVNTMGVQTANPTAATTTKRKYELIPATPEESNESYINACSPTKTSRWSTTISSCETEILTNGDISPSTTVVPSATSATTINSTAAATLTPNSIASNNTTTNGSCNTTTATPSIAATTPVLTTLAPAQRPLAVTNAICDDSIAKLEVVAAAPCAEPWNTEPIVDSISKLQAVTVPGDTWGGGISTRSTLATALLSSDEFDDDDDDFEDEFDDDESTIPTYCPLRYPPCTPPTKNYIYSGGYSKPPNFYSEPFPQQNCSRTGAAAGQQQSHHQPPQQPSQPPPHHPMRMPHFGSWSNNGGTTHSHQNGGGYYGPPPPPHHHPPPPHHDTNNTYSQQTIRCAENGKSYLELGSSNSFNSSSNNNVNVMHARHSKGCCDGRGMWCNSKICYKEVRLKIRNLSMFKLSKFRQVSEQSLYRSVLICNTLKHIDKEMETEGKDSMMMNHGPHPHFPHPHHPPQMHPRLSMDSSDSMNQGFHHHHHHHPPSHMQSPHPHSPPPPPPPPSPHQNHHQYSNGNHNPSLNDGSRAGSPGPGGGGDFTPTFNQMNSRLPALAFNTLCNGSDSLHPYDHHPFRDAQSGRATPYPSQTVTDNDSGYGGDDDCNRTINWSSVLSLSSQSALDPLNNNDLFSTIPAVAATSISTSSVTSLSSSSSSPSSQAATTISLLTCSSSSLTSITSLTTVTTPLTATTNVSGTFSTQPYSSSGTTVTPISPPSIGSSPASSWDYDFFDMDLGIRPEFTELLPSCKMSSSSADDLFKSVSPSLNGARYVHDNELEAPAHIMVGS